jgi:sodium-dependent dicarboxylate transporter 2/3/5
MTAWMVTWWIFEVLPLGVTALIPLFILPIFQVTSIEDVTPAYSNPVIFLFLGGFIIARALEKTKLDERVALKILSVTGKSDFGIVLGFVISTAFLSMWISNTATTVMMVPIAMSVLHFLKKNLKAEDSESIDLMSVVMFLSIAYSANIGGIMTPVGTPPNVVFIGYLNDLYSRKIDFWKWILVTAPVALSLLVIMLILLKKLFPFSFEIPPNFSGFLKDKIKSLGVINNSQRVTICVFFLAAFLWIFKGVLHQLAGTDFLNDTSIAIFSGFLLFLVPTSKKKFAPVLRRKDLSHLPWNIVLLFGGGMAMAASLKSVGLIQIATDYFGGLNFSSTYTLILVIAGLALFLTEIMSNVALCVVALPMIMKLGESQSVDPLLMALPAALCASFAFSMPVSTPPNAIVFGTNTVTVKQMLKAGIWLNFIALGITMTLGYYLMPFLL